MEPGARRTSDWKFCWSSEDQLRLPAETWRICPPRPNNYRTTLCDVTLHDQAPDHGGRKSPPTHPDPEQMSRKICVKNKLFTVFFKDSGSGVFIWTGWTSGSAPLSCLGQNQICFFKNQEGRVGPKLSKTSTPIASIQTIFRTSAVSAVMMGRFGFCPSVLKHLGPVWSCLSSAAVFSMRQTDFIHRIWSVFFRRSRSLRGRRLVFPHNNKYSFWRIVKEAQTESDAGKCVKTNYSSSCFFTSLLFPSAETEISLW